MAMVDWVKHALPMKLKDGKRHVFPTLASMVYLKDGTTPITDGNGNWNADKALNADKLGGKLPSEYAASDHTHNADDVGALGKNATAVNSEKLGDKEPKYYTNPKNLLKNSNFADPVNTNGFVNGSSVEPWSYHLNYWRTAGESQNITYNSDGIIATGPLCQQTDVLKDYVGKSVTLAASFDDGKTVAVSGVVIESSEWNTFAYEDTNISMLGISASSSGQWEIRVDGKGKRVKWVTLYEGTYKANNVPPPFIYPKRLEMLNLGLPVQPENLLDNSDFQNPINRRGQTDYDSHGYTIDRWMLEAGVGNGIQTTESGVVFKQTDSLIVFVQPIAEQVRERLIGKMVTAVAELTDGSISVSRAIVPASSGSVDSPQLPIGNSDLKINIYSAVNHQLHFRLLAQRLSSDVTVARVALYEGSYTAETLPPYTPKGYATELAACNAAPVDLGGGYGGGSLQAYPVGSFYISSKETSPASLFGGTWLKHVNRFLVGAGEYYLAGQTGGEAEHTLTIDEMPSHTHKISRYSSAGTETGTGLTREQNTTISKDTNCGAFSTGGSQPHNNMPPWLAVNIWERTE